MQLHENNPVVFVHVAFVEQPPLFVAHSFTSVHVTPFPAYPALHSHVNDPAVFVHVALPEQLLAPVPHSFTSVQLVT